MPYTYFNPNPFQHFIEDCAARALSKALSIDWDMASAILANAGIKMGYNADDKRVFYAILREQGFDREVIPNTCPDCYTAEDFCIEHPKGTYILGFGDHVAAVVDGTIYDTWDSRKEKPFFYWHKKEGESES